MRRLLILTLALASCGSCQDGAVGAAGDAAADARAKDAGHDGAADAEVDAGPTDDAMPASSSAELSTRARHLLEAIAQDNPDLATDILFPRDAWSQARDGQDPAKVWDTKTKPAFASGIHSWAKRSKDMTRAQFVSFEIGKTVTQIEPKKKEWKKPLWQVKHSKLTFTVDGQARHLEVAEMVGWRGAWYVTHLK